MEWLSIFYIWVKALHVLAVFAWMAGLFYLPRLFVYHAERAGPGTDLEATFLVMEDKLLRLIMRPAMIVAWLAGLTLIAMGALDLGAVWGWAKLVGVVAMTAFHIWLAARRKDFAAGRNMLTGRRWRMMNEVPTAILLVIVVAVIVRPF